MQKNLVILILLLMLTGGISYYFRHSVIIGGNQQPDVVVIATTTPTTQDVSTSTMKVKVALLGAQMETSNKDRFRGCDVVELQEREVPYSQTPLTAALRELFSKKDIWMPGELAPGNFIASQTELFFDTVSIENGIAKIYLLGKIGPLNGVCDDPRLRIQLEETSLQFNTIQKVEFYLNGIKTDLTFSQKGN